MSRDRTLRTSLDCCLISSIHHSCPLQTLDPRDLKVVLKRRQIPNLWLKELLVKLRFNQLHQDQDSLAEKSRFKLKFLWEILIDQLHIKDSSSNRTKASLQWHSLASRIWEHQLWVFIKVTNLSNSTSKLVKQWLLHIYRLSNLHSIRHRQTQILKTLLVPWSNPLKISPKDHALSMKRRSIWVTCRIQTINNMMWGK